MKRYELSAAQTLQTGGRAVDAFDVHADPTEILTLDIVAGMHAGVGKPSQHRGRSATTFEFTRVGEGPSPELNEIGAIGRMTIVNDFDELEVTKLAASKAQAETFRAILDGKIPAGTRMVPTRTLTAGQVVVNPHQPADRSQPWITLAKATYNVATVGEVRLLGTNEGVVAQVLGTDGQLIDFLGHSAFSTTDVVPFPQDGETILGLMPEDAVLTPSESTTNGITPGAVVKSSTDDLVGRVVRLENVKRGEFAQIEDADGKQYGRKASTLAPLTD